MPDKDTTRTCNVGENDETSRPTKKQRKQRPCYSCEECRRLKMRCDRQVPCSNCLRRQRVKFCKRVVSNGSFVCEAANTLSAQTEDFPIQLLRAIAEQASRDSPAYFDFESSGLQQSEQNLLTNNIELRNSQVIPIPSCVTETSSRTSGLLCSPPKRSITEPFERLDNVEQSGSYGTLMMSRGGRSKYLGPTAGSEWLKNSQMPDVSCTPSVTRSPSPDFLQAPGPFQLSCQMPLKTVPIAFPFNASAAHIRTHDLLAQLPPADEAWTLVESYYRYCAWHHDVAPKNRFKNAFDRVYSLSAGCTSSPPVNFQEIALVFMIMAKGTTYNIEMPNNDSSSEDWLHLAEMALVKGDFLSNNTIAGVQTLHLMAHMNFQSDEGRHDDKAWLLWGLVMRLIQAMGMHRDGARWNLPQDIVEERRKVFWECNAADIFQAHCFSRPCTINTDHCDTAFPSEPVNLNGEKSYYRLRFELSQLSSVILNMAMKARRPPYSEVTEMDQKLCEFEKDLPFYIRCRAALIATTSRYPRVEDAIDASPGPSRRSMTISFQQMNLALNICETVINLHRPYYAKALYDDTDVNDKSVYAPSFFAVIERSAIIIAVVTDIHTRFPTVSTRQWNFWYHVFGSALCLGTLVLRHPGHAMATFVLSQIDAAIALFTSLVQNGANTPRYQRNLQWLSKLRARASAKISASFDVQNMHNEESLEKINTVQKEGGREGGEDSEEVELLGWRTRLIKHADQNYHSKASRVASTSSMSPNDALMASSQPLPQSTDELLHDFWDPIILHDLLEGSNEQPNSFMNSGPSWWEDGVIIPDTT